MTPPTLTRLSWTITALLLPASCLLLPGCSAPNESSRANGTSGSTSSVLREYEARFDPSAHDPATGKVRNHADSTAIPGDIAPGTGGPAAAETVPGFRVQLLVTTDIDDANARKSQAEAAFPEELFYLDFDPPTYKLRAGNFQTKFEADRFARNIAQHGFSDAWTVPTRVFKNPPLPSHAPTAPADSLGGNR